MKLHFENTHSPFSSRPQDTSVDTGEPSGPKRGILAGQLLVFKEELCLMGLYCVNDVSNNGILFVIKLLTFCFPE